MGIVAASPILWLLVANLQAGADASLPEVIARHTRAIGGAGALHSIRSLRITLTIVEPTFHVDAVYVADRGMHMRIDVSAGGRRIYSEGFDGAEAWQMGEDAATVKEESAAGAKALQNGILVPDRFYSLDDLRAKGHDLQMEGRESVGGVSYYVLRLTVHASVTHLYVHPTSWLIERTRETKPLHPDIDPTPQTTETVYSDFRTVDGVVRPFRSVRTNLDNGNVLQTETIQKVETNPDLSHSFFARPSVSPAR